MSGSTRRPGSGGPPGGGYGAGPGGKPIRLPLLDRLLDDDPAAAVDPPQRLICTPERLREAVQRDLTYLLNARRRRRIPPPEWVELPSSIIGYGVPDVTSGGLAQSDRKQFMGREVETAIRRFEPRLEQPHVTVRNINNEMDRTLSLRVEAVLRSDPLPEEVSFDTTFRPEQHKVVVSGG